MRLFGYLRLGLDESVDLSLDGFDLAIEEVEVTRDAFNHGTIGSLAAPVLLLGPHLDHLIAPFCKLGQGVALGAGRRIRGGRHRAGESGKRAGVDRIGFG